MSPKLEAMHRDALAKIEAMPFRRGGNVDLGDLLRTPPELVVLPEISDLAAFWLSGPKNRDLALKSADAFNSRRSK